MKKLIPYILLLLPILILFNCKSAPEVGPGMTPEPTAEGIEATPAPTPTPTPVATSVVNPVTEQEILEVQNAIARAEEVNAAEYAKTELDDAKNALAQARQTKDDNPAGARSLLSQAKASADMAFEKAAQETAASYSRRLRLAKEKLLEIEADKFLPATYNPLIAAQDKVESLYNGNQFVEALELADDTLAGMNALYSELSEKLKYIANLKKDTDKNLKAAEKYEAYLWTPEKLAQINEYYFLGVSSLEEYKLDNAEEYLGYSKELSVDMLAAAVKLKKAKETEALKNEVLNLLDESSRLNVVTEDGEIISADPIDMEAFIKSIEDEMAEDAGEPQALLQLDTDGVIVLADITKDSLLNQAKELIKLGIVAERNGQLDEAMDYYIQAKNYLRLHKAQSVSQVYTVRLIPQRRDCLWRIAEYDFIYGDPYLWPLIWRRNRKQIQNPNLIEPNWQLIIPER